MKKPEDSAFTRISGKLVEYRKATLPASLQTSGALFYGVPSGSASGVIIRTPTGKLIVSEGSRIALQSPEEVCTHHQRTRAALNRLPPIRHAITQIAQCLRRHGFDVTEPNLTGPGPVLNTHNINTKGAPYIAAKAKCVKEVLPALRSAFSRSHSRVRGGRANL